MIIRSEEVVDGEAVMACGRGEGLRLREFWPVGGVGHKVSS